MTDKKKKIQNSINAETQTRSRAKDRSSREKDNRKKIQKAQAIICVLTSINNSFLNLTDFEGKTIAKASAGNFASGPVKKDSAFAALRAATALATISLEKNIQRVLLVFKGFGKARLSIATGLRSAGLKITAIHQKLSLPHNGCRPRKKRRL